MNLFLIVLSLIFFYGNSISGAGDNELEAVDVLSTIKTTSPDCDLVTFVKHTEDYTAFSSDLKTYCSSNTKKQNRILCNMIAYELKKACQSEKTGRPSPVIYSRKSTPKEICFSKTIQLTNQWIWNAITNNGQKQIDVTAKELCDKVTSDENTLQLARFFYRAAPHVRNADRSKTSKNDTKSNLSKQTPTESISKTVEEAKDAAVGADSAVKDKTKSLGGDAKDASERAVETGKTKMNGTTKAIKQKATDAAEDGKSKADEAGQVLKQKAEKTADDAQEKADETLSNAKNKGEEAVKTGKGKIDDGVETVKEKAKPKTDDNGEDDNDADDKTKAKSDNDDDDDADKDKTDNTKKKADKDADGTKDKLTDASKLSKNIGDKIANGTKVVFEKGKGLLNKLTNKTSAASKTADEQGKVLDLKQDKKTDQNADADDDEEEKDDNVDGNGKTKDDGQAKQIPQPGTVDKKDDAKKKKKPTDVVKDADADQDDDDKDDETQHKVDDMDKKSQQAGNKDGDNDGISLRKPNANDKYTPKPVVADPNKGKGRPKTQVGRKYSGDDGWSGSFVTYFLLFTLFVVVGYLVLHNKNKLMAYVLEGRRTSGSRTGSRPSHRGYEKLKNINDIIPIDDTNPVSDKEAVILKA